jgi:hypothetical protein
MLTPSTNSLIVTSALPLQSPVQLCAGSEVGVGVGLNGAISLCDGEGVGDGAVVGVSVTVGVAESVAAPIVLLVGAGEPVAVGVRVTVRVGVLVGVWVRVGVRLGVAVAVSAGANATQVPAAVQVVLEGQSASLVQGWPTMRQGIKHPTQLPSAVHCSLMVKGLKSSHFAPTVTVWIHRFWLSLQVSLVH